MPRTVTPLIDRIKDRIFKTDSCWFWVGTISRTGYGVISGDGKKGMPAHRAVYELFVANVPDSQQLDHLCRVRACVNPDHLEVVTRTENLRRGNSTKLSLPEIAIIRSSNLKQKVLAAMFEVHPSQISKIRNNKQWRTI